MTLRADLRAFLVADATLAGLVGSRVYHDQAPQGTARPFLTLRRSYVDHVDHLGAATDLTRQDYEVMVWADSPTAREAVSEAVRSRLDRAEGTIGSTVVDRMHVEGEIDFVEPPEGGEEFGAFRTLIDVQTWHREALPASAD